MTLCTQINLVPKPVLAKEPKYSHVALPPSSRPQALTRILREFANAAFVAPSSRPQALTRILREFAPAGLCRPIFSAKALTRILREFAPAGL